MPETAMASLRSTDPAERLAAWAETIEQAPDAKAARRALAENDLAYLLVAICGRTDLLHPWLLARCDEVQDSPDGHIDLWAREHGKALALTEPVPTPDGWRSHGDIKVGDLVFAPNGSTTRVVALSPVFRDADCFTIEWDDGSTTVASGSHLWAVERRSRRRVPGTHRIGAGKRITRERVLMTTKAIAAHDHAPNNRLAVSACAPVDMPTVDLPVDPYVLGAWLGDGTTGHPCLTAGAEDADDMAKTIRSRGVAVRIRASASARTLTLGTGVRWQKGSSDIANGLRAAGVLHDKRVPEIYMRASAHQRMELLRGLMDTDGFCDKRGTASFTNTNPRLAEAVYELAASLGYKPRETRRQTRCGAAVCDCWTVSFQTRAGLAPFALPRKVARCKNEARPLRHFIVRCTPRASEPVSCIQVDREDGMYVTGRAWRPTHNSSIITFGKSLQDIARDAETTIGIFSHTRPIAKAFLIQIMRELEQNPQFHELWPWIFWADPRREAPKWSEDGGIIVRRKTNPKEATVEAWGLVDGQPTGRHFKVRVYDDTVTRESVTTPEQVRKTTEAWELSDNLGVEGGAVRIIGTRYSFADTYAEILGRAIAKPRIYPATHDGTLKGKPVLFTEAEWERRKLTQGSQVAPQLLQNPTAGLDTSFRPHWLRSYEVRPLVINVAILVDPSKGSPNRRSDRTAMPVIGSDTRGNRFLLDGYCHRMDLEERYKLLKQIYRKWSHAQGIQGVMVGYERYGAQSDIEAMEWRMREEGISIPIEELNTPRDHTRAKQDRYERLVPDFKTGSFFLPMILAKPAGGTEAWYLQRGDGDPNDPETPVMLAYKDLLGPTRAQRKAMEEGRRDMIVGPIKRMDERKQVYDLTRMFIDEYLHVPFAVFDDLIDATSRIYDVSGTVLPPAEVIPPETLEPQVYSDT